MKPSWKILAASVVVLAIGLASWAAPGLKSESKVKTAVKSTKDADGGEVVTITLRIEKGWHLYANPVGLESLDGSETKLTFDGAAKPEVVKVEYPAGKLVKDAIVGDHRVYEDQVTIKATVRRKGDAGLTAAIRVQACSDKTCLQPSTIKVSVP